MPLFHQLCSHAIPQSIILSFRAMLFSGSISSYQASKSRRTSVTMMTSTRSVLVTKTKISNTKISISSISSSRNIRSNRSRNASKHCLRCALLLHHEQKSSHSSDIYFYGHLRAEDRSGRLRSSKTILNDQILGTNFSPSKEIRNGNMLKN